MPLSMTQESKIGSKAESNQTTIDNAFRSESVIHVLPWTLMLNLKPPEKIIHDLAIFDNVIDYLYDNG